MDGTCHAARRPCAPVRGTSRLKLTFGPRAGFAAAQDDSTCERFQMLANPRQLFPAEHVHHAVAADAALQDHRAAGSLFHFTDANRPL